MQLFLRQISIVKIHLTLPELVFYFSHYLNSEFEAVDEVIA